MFIYLCCMCRNFTISKVKQKRQSNIIYIYFKNVEKQLKHKIFNLWKNGWNTWTEYSDREYAQNVTQPCQKAWFTKPNNLISRLITNIRKHCSTPKHLQKMKCKDNNKCNCRELDDINHINFECPLIHRPRPFCHNLCKKMFEKHLNVESMLSKPMNSVWLLY